MTGAIPDPDLPEQTPAEPTSPGAHPGERWGKPARVIAALAVLGVIVGAVVGLQRLQQSGPTVTDTPGYVSFASSGVKLGAASGETLAIGKPAPDFTLMSLDGQSLRPADLRGKVVLINFWASWCAPCRKEMPLLVQAAEQFRERGFEMVAINIQEDRSRVVRFADEFGMRFPVLLDVAGDVTQQYRVQGLPTSYLIDREGIVRERKIGEYREADLTTAIERMLEEPAP